MAHLGPFLLTALAVATPGAAPFPSTLPAAGPGDDAPTLEEVRRAVERSIEHLLRSQETYEPDPAVGRLPSDKLEEWQDEERRRLKKFQGRPDAAEWPYEGVYRVGKDRNIPSGYRVGGTAIVCDALLWCDTRDERTAKVRRAVQRSIDFTLEHIEDDPELSIGPKEGYDVRGWGHAYALQFFLTALEREAIEGEDRMAHVAATIPVLIDRIAANQTSMGGWNYANARAVSPFMTGATLLILFDAKARGYDVDGDMVERALGALQKARTETGSFAYSGRARSDGPMPGSAARAACAERALFKAGRSDVERLRTAITGFFEGWDALLDRKSKQGTHEGDYGIAPYYFFFGHAYVALAIEELPKAERPTRRAELARLLWETRDDDGTWNDRVFPRTSSYSTAMVVFALTAPARPRPALWAPSPLADNK